MNNLNLNMKKGLNFSMIFSLLLGIKFVARKTFACTSKRQKLSSRDIGEHQFYGNIKQAYWCRTFLKYSLMRTDSFRLFKTITGLLKNLSSGNGNCQQTGFRFEGETYELIVDVPKTVHNVERALFPRAGALRKYHAILWFGHLL